MGTNEKKVREFIYDGENYLIEETKIKEVANKLNNEEAILIGDEEGDKIFGFLYVGTPKNKDLFIKTVIEAYNLGNSRGIESGKALKQFEIRKTLGLL